jgi:hypothetical protein
MALLETLAAAEKRRFVRTSASGKRRFAVGLSRLISELAGAGPHHQPLPDYFEEPPADAGTAQPYEDEDEGEEEEEIVLGQSDSIEEPAEIWTKRGKKSVYFNKPAAEPAEPAESPPAAEAASAELVGSLLNISAGGYCLLWLNAMVAGGRVGELIGIYEETGRIHVGVIRWLHHKAKAELVIGVELFSPQVEAVDIESGPGGDAAPRGLYFLANHKLGHPASLLCAPGTFKTGQTAVLRGKGEPLRFRLESLLGSTLSFQSFSLARPEHDPNPDQSTQTFFEE